jgi:hypothetical protein
VPEAHGRFGSYLRPSLATDGTRPQSRRGRAPACCSVTPRHLPSTGPPRSALPRLLGRLSFLRRMRRAATHHPPNGPQDHKSNGS